MFGKYSEFGFRLIRKILNADNDIAYILSKLSFESYEKYWSRLFPAWQVILELQKSQPEWLHNHWNIIDCATSRWSLTVSLLCSSQRSKGYDKLAGWVNVERVGGCYWVLLLSEKRLLISSLAISLNDFVSRWRFLKLTNRGKINYQWRENLNGTYIKSLYVVSDYSMVKV